MFYYLLKDTYVPRDKECFIIHKLPMCLRCFMLSIDVAFRANADIIKLSYEFIITFIPSNKYDKLELYTFFISINVTFHYLDYFLTSAIPIFPSVKLNITFL